MERPAEDEPAVDDVNWFARPVANPDGRWIGFASHDQNYLYDLTRGRRIRIPDRSDAVATPDGDRKALAFELRAGAYAIQDRRSSLGVHEFDSPAVRRARAEAVGR